MVEYSVQSAIDISVIEILLITILAFIGAFIHEYASFIQKGKRITLMVWANIFVTVVIDVIVSISINPFLIPLNPRLIMLPPLLIGLLGTELVSKLSTINGSASLIEYILGFFHLTKAKGTNTPTDPVNEEAKAKNDKMLQEINNVKLQIESLIAKYSANHDSDEFIAEYNIIKDKTGKIKNYINDHRDVGIDVIIKLSETVKLEIALDRIFENLISDYYNHYQNHHK